jgi:hypothetical protein
LHIVLPTQAEKFHNCLPQLNPSYSAVMPNMTDYTDGFSFARMFSSNFTLCDQVVAIKEPADIPWHVSCDVYIFYNMRAT